VVCAAAVPNKASREKAVDTQDKVFMACSLRLNLDPAVTRPPAAPAAASVARWQVQCGR